MVTKKNIYSALAPYLPASPPPKTASDDIFCMIASTPKLLHAYKRWPKSVNSLISKIIKEHYGFDNAVDAAGKNCRNTSPKSILIKSYQEFC